MAAELKFGLTHWRRASRIGGCSFSRGRETTRGTPLCKDARMTCGFAQTVVRTEVSDEEKILVPRRIQRRTVCFSTRGRYREWDRIHIRYAVECKLSKCMTG